MNEAHASPMCHCENMGWDQKSKFPTSNQNIDAQSERYMEHNHHKCLSSVLVDDGNSAESEKNDNKKSDTPDLFVNVFVRSFVIALGILNLDVRLNQRL